MFIKNPDDLLLSTHGAVRSLLLRVATVGLYLAVYKNIQAITSTILEVLNHPFFFLLFVYESRLLFRMRESFLKGFVLIILFSTTLIPIFRLLLREIDTDTIFLWFGICQVLFCLDAARTSIMNHRPTEKRQFRRTDVIPIEESIMIPIKTEENGVFGYTAAMVGFFALFSRISDNTQVLILEGTGFLFYLFFPYVLERFKVHLHPVKTFLVILSLIIYQLLADVTIFVIFLGIISSLFTFSYFIIEILKKTEKS